MDKDKEAYWRGRSDYKRHALLRGVPPLKHLDIDITWDCNWDCVHCSARGRSYISVAEELTREEIISILKQAKSLGVEDVGFTGGEPLLRSEDLLFFLKYCKDELHVKTHLLTNGSLINKTPHIKEIISYTDRVRVTLLGFKETHEKLTRSPGSFEAVIDGIKTLQDLNANFQVAFVPMRQNYKELPGLMEMLFKNYGVTKFRLLDLAPTGRAMEIWGHISLSIEEKVWLSKELERVSSTHGIDLRVGFHTSLSFSSLKKLKGHEICTAGITRCHVNAVGEVFPCTAATGQPILSGGNLRRFNLDLAYVWRSAPVFQMLRYFRRHPPPPCDTCKWWSSCTGGCKVELNYNYNSIAIPNPECEIVKQVKEKSGEEDVYDKS